MMGNHYNKENGRKNMRLHGYDYSRTGLYFLTIVVQNRLHLFGEIRGDGPAGPSQMFLNDAGNMVAKWYYEIENKFPDKRCHEMVVMPNHFHCIIENVEMDGYDDGTDAHGPGMDDKPGMDAHGPEMDGHGPGMDDNPGMDGHGPEMDAHVGAPLRGRPDDNVRPDANGRPDANVRPDDVDRPDDERHPNAPRHPQNAKPKYGIHNKRYDATIGHVMDWFKTMTTNGYIRGVKTNNWKRFDGKLWQRNYYDHIIRDDRAYQKISEYIINNPAKWNDDKFNTE